MSGRVYVRRRGMTHLPNQTVYDTRLSYAAVGLLVVLLSRPDGAPQGYRDLQGRGLGKDATLNALRELTEAGYRHQIIRSGASGRIVTDTVVSEEPIDSDTAERWLNGERLPVDNPHHRAAESRARSDLGRRSVSAGRTVRGLPGSGQPPHSPSDSKDPYGVHGETSPCEHGTPKGARYCALCRHAAQAAPRLSLVPTVDTRQRAAGEHLE